MTGATGMSTRSTNRTARSRRAGFPGRWGLWIALAMSVLSLARRLAAGPLGLWRDRRRRARRLGLFGRTGPAEAVGLVGAGPGRSVATRALPWFTGAAVLAAGAPAVRDRDRSPLLYGIGAHGIMTLNDFKALEGDRQMGVQLPARDARAGTRGASWPARSWRCRRWS